MSDEQKTESPATEEPRQEPEKKLFGLPLSVFVKGGTTTSAHDRQVAEIEADAERRRDEAAAERRIASIPIEHGGGQILTNKMTENANTDAGFVLLKYLTPSGELRYENGDELQCLADVHMLSLDELCLTIVCPGCKARGVPQGQAQLRIRQSNKRFELDVSKAGELIVFDGKAYRSAGLVRESERFRCPDCGWAARITNNMVRPE